ncbi:MAG: 2-dehydropantoate 2-reductase [Tyzzerella sp.]|uniref:2-dehydropantoate 2-reductase n=1 Tax=Candidatus Fimicola merdigallinarum TaxID=2840819 RepID=A0A9D9DWP2_9FIRM|nr:2-dehydropantoate 2-reductase [Candidatus Fimicola merdigallinarum]
MEIKKMGIMGMGAIGGIYGKELMNTFGDDFYAVADGERGERLKKNGIKVNGDTIFPKVLSTTNPETKLDFLILAIKNYQLEESFSEIRNIIHKDTIILPLLNGVTATERIKEAFPENEVLRGLVYITAEKRENGEIYSNNKGTITFGDTENKELSQSVKLVKDIFDKAGINYNIPEDMISAQWRKWIINIGSNQVSAIVRNGYGKFLEIEELNKVLKNAMFEVVEVAKACGVYLPVEDVDGYDERLKVSQPDLKTSTLQDIENKRRTEIEYFAGDLIRMAKKVGVSVPVNETLYYLIKSIEKMYS